MSNVPIADFDFWEFVACSRCQVPFAGSSVPFWLTECGHVVCNTHLNADQSCVHCGTTGIQLVPLQQEMEAPMSDWFRSIPHALDSVAYAAKFQQETMAFQIQYYKSRHQQQRTLLDRFKREMAELKKVNDMLAHENAQFREHMGYGEPSGTLNLNGKRPMNDPDQYIPRTSSSRSRSTITPLGPNRLTLPPGQQPPNLSSNRPQEELSFSKTGQRPGSSRFAEQYSYIPASTQQLQLSQGAPRRTKQNQEQRPPQGQPQAASVSNSTRFKPAQGGSHNKAIPNQLRPRNMGPPPTPQQMHPQAVIPPSARRGRGNTSLPSNQRFAPSAPANSQHFMSSNNAPQRFPVDGSNSVPQIPAASSRAPSRAAGPGMAGMSGSGQRVPFVPGGFG